MTGLPAAEMFAFRFNGAKGGLPLNRSTVQWITRLQLAIKLFAAATLFVFLLAVALKSAALGVFAILPILGIVTSLGVIRKRVPQGSVDGNHLHLTNVHSSFVQALEQPPSAAHKCAGCPSVSNCSNEKVEACDGFDPSKASAHH